jgi:glycerol-3-phosphate dehydrogenase
MCSLFGFRLEHRNLTDDELDRLVKQTFRIDQATLRELDGVGDLLSVCYSERDRNF